ncbi:MAG: hypothetical protein ABI045_03505 [Flavobacteriales bacterium]
MAQQYLSFDGLSDSEEIQNYQAFANSANSVIGVLYPIVDNYIYYFDNRWD